MSICPLFGESWTPRLLKGQEPPGLPRGFCVFNRAQCRSCRFRNMPASIINRWHTLLNDLTIGESSGGPCLFHASLSMVCTYFIFGICTPLGFASHEIYLLLLPRPMSLTPACARLITFLQVCLATTCLSTLLVFCSTAARTKFVGVEASRVHWCVPMAWWLFVFNIFWNCLGALTTIYIDDADIPTAESDGYCASLQASAQTSSRIYLYGVGIGGGIGGGALAFFKCVIAPIMLEAFKQVQRPNNKRDESQEAEHADKKSD